NRFGLLNRDWIPFPIRVVAAILLIDLMRYGLHWVEHAVPMLWRVHQVHHSDTDFDLSTGLRAHPLERLISFVSYQLVIVLLAPPPIAVLISEALSVGQTFLSHANASLPEWIDRPLRALFITPNMHRVHHSVEIPEQNTNFGDIF